MIQNFNLLKLTYKHAPLLKGLSETKELQLEKIFSQKFWNSEIWSLVRNYKNYFFN